MWRGGLREIRRLDVFYVVGREVDDHGGIGGGHIGWLCKAGGFGCRARIVVACGCSGVRGVRDNEGLGVKRCEVSKVRFCSDFEGLLGVLCDVLCVVLFSGKLRASSK